MTNSRITWQTVAWVVLATVGVMALFLAPELLAMIGGS